MLYATSYVLHRIKLSSALVTKCRPNKEYTLTQCEPENEEFKPFQNL